MVHISKRKVSAKVLAEMKTQLVNIFFVQNSRKNFESVLYNLLTPSEHILLAKRVMAIGLLDLGYSTYQVSELLCMSPTTLGKIQNKVENTDSFSSITKTLKTSRGRKIFIENLVALLTPGGASKKLQQQLYTDIDKWKSGM
ncbi:MAG: hypothetical protein JKX80_02775 [Candidatus Pacebacteria bacterium]|nr:hypothetical protein [Candidatus Paceibacterota bacterium]